MEQLNTFKQYSDDAIKLAMTAMNIAQMLGLEYCLKYQESTRLGIMESYNDLVFKAIQVETIIHNEQANGEGFDIGQWDEYCQEAVNDILTIIEES